jgi:redox-sensing transcriptional repressor
VPAHLRKISESTVRRLSLYLRALEALAEEGERTASSEELARRVGTTAPQVRKDLSTFGSFGKRGLGYPIPPLVSRLRDILGLSRPWSVALIGAGRIGSALHAYPAFRERGFRIIRIFDDDPGKIGERWGETVIQDAADLEEEARRAEIEIAIVAVPAEAAQAVAERAARAGVRAILNFAPARLDLPAGVVVNDVNLAMELEALSYALGSDDSEGRAT